ncbi:MAG: hypothetical protein JWO23_2814, partial [Solirubrobacterales bacterium]|nr:hypothetical protein [Solirubrobacterales bacterium]
MTVSRCAAVSKLTRSHPGMRWSVALAASALVFLAAQSTAGAAVRIETLSNRADLISGGDALVRVALAKGTQPSEVKVLVGARDVTSAFAVRANGDYEGTLGQLNVGDNVVKAVLPNGSGAQLTLTDHPIGGPVFSGPQIEPWVCGTEAAGLGPPTDAQCDAPSAYRYEYKSSVTGQFQSYNAAGPPSDVASTTTDQGVTMPYIVR